MYKLNEHSIPEIEKIIVIADSHLGYREGDVEEMIQFIQILNPQTDSLIFLGDLFHIWAGSPQYQNKENTSFLKALAEYQKKGGSCSLVVGNRDIFFPEKENSPKQNKLPFNYIANDYLKINWGQKILLFNHGDLVNLLDKQYLRWRKIVKSRWFKFFFKLLPSGKVKKTIINTERKLKTTNQAFRIEFPEDQWQKFLKKINKELSPDLCLIGHFHPEVPIITEEQNTKGIVVPDWMQNRSYLEINSNLEIKHSYFND